MATLVQTGLDFDVIENELERQVELLGGEFFVTVVSASLERLDETEGIQTPLDTVVREYYQRYMEGYELRVQLDEEEPKSVGELAAELSVSDEDIGRRYEYLNQYGFAERTSDGIRDTGKHDEFTRS
ncbi:hypothetical protein EXE40_04990 [Halorubrum sp. GN11GM_10-3_MGM]|nr:hypothetical protein EXE40_04990 [Halorubrum sp. GN11GM_10-3_MGM]